MEVAAANDLPAEVQGKAPLFFPLLFLKLLARGDGRGLNQSFYTRLLPPPPSFFALKFCRDEFAGNQL